MKQSDPAKRDLETSRFIAAWIKAFDSPPTGSELSSFLGCSPAVACGRMWWAWKRGWLHRDQFAGLRRYTPVYERLPFFLREQRPVI